MSQPPSPSALHVVLHQHAGTAPYLARIVGTCAQYGLARVFSTARRVSSRSGKTAELHFALKEEGLYEIGKSRRDDGYYYVARKKSGGLGWFACSGARALAMARLLDTGAPWFQVRQETKGL